VVPLLRGRPESSNLESGKLGAALAAFRVAPIRKYFFNFCRLRRTVSQFSGQCFEFNIPFRGNDRLRWKRIVFLSAKIRSAAARARTRSGCRGRDPAFEARYRHEASAPLSSLIPRGSPLIVTFVAFLPFAGCSCRRKASK